MQQMGRCRTRVLRREAGIAEQLNQIMHVAMVHERLSTVKPVLHRIIEKDVAEIRRT